MQLKFKMLITVTVKLWLRSYNEQFVKVALERSQHVMYCSNAFRSRALLVFSLYLTSCVQVFPPPDSDLNQITSGRLIFRLSKLRQPLTTSCGDIIN